MKPVSRIIFCIKMTDWDRLRLKPTLIWMKRLVTQGNDADSIYSLNRRMTDFLRIRKRTRICFSEKLITTKLSSRMFHNCFLFWWIESKLENLNHVIWYDSYHTCPYELGKNYDKLSLKIRWKFHVNPVKFTAIDQSATVTIF